MGFAPLLQPQAIAVAPGVTPAQATAPTQPGTLSVSVDGTPVRVVVLCLAAAAGLTALKWGGFRFNVGVSN